MDFDRPTDEMRHRDGQDEGDPRQALSRRALLAGGAGVAGLVAGAGLLGRSGTASAAPTAAGISTMTSGPLHAFMQFYKPSSGGTPVGESQDTFFKQWIEVSSFSFGAKNPIVLGSGAGAGKLTFNELIIRRPVDNAGPQLFQAAALGGHFQEVKLALRKVGAAPSAAFLTFYFGTVFVSEVKWSQDESDGIDEEVTLVYGQMAMQYHKQNPDGTLGQKNQTAWDQFTNQAWTPTIS